MGGWVGAISEVFACGAGGCWRLGNRVVTWYVV